MSEMTAAKATALRKPFPKESIGKLPKPYKSDSPRGNCGECGGYHGLPAAHLDFVGHAAVTDRLLTVDPNWSWEPMATDQFGSPERDRDGNLWIRLTLCGVTRLGVGDGKNMKERIGDAIRNAAMRFGVGLDLWAKENLVEFAQAASLAPTPRPAQTPEAIEAGYEALAADQAAGPMTARTRGQLFALFGQKGVAEADQLSGVNHLNGTAHESRSDITEAEAKSVIAVLKLRPDVKDAT